MTTKANEHVEKAVKIFKIFCHPLGKSGKGVFLSFRISHLPHHKNGSVHPQ